MIDIQDMLAALKSGKEEEDISDIDAFMEEAMVIFIMARALADMRSWLKMAGGPNSEALLGTATRLHLAVLDELAALEQTSYMLWGVQFYSMGGKKR